MAVKTLNSAHPGQHAHSHNNASLTGATRRCKPFRPGVLVLRMTKRKKVAPICLHVLKLLWDVQWPAILGRWCRKCWLELRNGRQLSSFPFRKDTFPIHINID